MTVSELIEQLKKVPQDLPVMVHWDSGVRSDVDLVYVAIPDEEDFVSEKRDRLVLSSEYEAIWPRNFPKKYDGEYSYLTLYKDKEHNKYISAKDLIEWQKLNTKKSWNQ